MIATIKSIAAEANISHQAVSAVLNNKTNCRVSPATRERILRIAREKGYRTNFGYKLMQGQATETVAIVISMRQMEHEEFVQEMVMKLMGRFNELGYATYLNNRMTRDPLRNVEQIQDLIRRGAQSFLFFGTPFGYREITAELRRQRCTFVGFKSEFERNLHVDSRRGTLKMLAFLRERIGNDFRLLLPAPLEQTPGTLRSRFDALPVLFPELPLEELSARYVTALPPLAWEEPDFISQMYRNAYLGTEQVMREKHPPQALMFLSDNYALGGAAWLHEHGYRVGRDILVSGYNNTQAVRSSVLPILSAEHPQERIIEILLEESRKTTDFRMTLNPIIHYRYFDGNTRRETVSD